jgi:hypothetical protein
LQQPGKGLQPKQVAVGAKISGDSVTSTLDFTEGSSSVHFWLPCSEKIQIWSV